MHRSVIDALENPLFAIDGSGTVLEWNRASARATGYSDEELADAISIESVLDADAAQLWEATEADGGPVEAALITAEGDRLPHGWELHRVASDGDVLALVGRERSARTEGESGRSDPLEHRQRVLREMHDIIADRERAFTEQVSALLELGRRELGTDYGTLSEIRGDEYRFEVVAADDDSVQSGDVAPLSATNCELAATDERTIVLGDIARDAPTETDRAGYAEWGVSCYIGGPVFVEDEVYGTFCFYGNEPLDGQFSDWEVTIVDLMSRWVGYELQRQRSNKRLKRQNKRLDGFAAIVSHDLRNPLNVLSGRLELAAETGDSEHFDHCHDALERMNALIDELLTLARSGDVIDAKTDVDVRSLLEQCWLTVPTEDAALRVETDRTVRADETRFQQLLENLLRNAIEHGGTGVTITVGDLADGFYVADDGPGIPADIREEVFEMEYSTTTDGTGFGLAIVAEIAGAHGWHVRATEATDGGARFEFTDVSSAD